MPNYSAQHLLGKNDVLLVRYPFSDLSGVKVRPAVVVHASHPSQDSLIVPLTSKLTSLLPGEFVLKDWEKAGLNVPTAAKRGIYTIHPSLIAKFIGHLSAQACPECSSKGFSKFGKITARMVGALIVL